MAALLKFESLCYFPSSRKSSLLYVSYAKKKSSRLSPSKTKIPPFFYMLPDLHHMNYHNHHPSLLLHSMNHNIFHCVQACHHVLVIASQSGATNSILPNCYHITMGVNGERVLTSMGARTIGDAALKIPPSDLLLVRVFYGICVACWSS